MIRVLSLSFDSYHKNSFENCSTVSSHLLQCNISFVIFSSEPVRVLVNPLQAKKIQESDFLNFNFLYYSTFVQYRGVCPLWTM